MEKAKNVAKKKEYEPSEIERNVDDTHQLKPSHSFASPVSFHYIASNGGGGLCDFNDDNESN